MISWMLICSGELEPGGGVRLGGERVHGAVPGRGGEGGELHLEAGEAGDCVHLEIITTSETRTS